MTGYDPPTSRKACTPSLLIARTPLTYSSLPSSDIILNSASPFPDATKLPVSQQQKSFENVAPPTVRAGAFPQSISLIEEDAEAESGLGQSLKVDKAVEPCQQLSAMGTGNIGGACGG